MEAVKLHGVGAKYFTPAIELSDLTLRTHAIAIDCFACRETFTGKNLPLQQQEGPSLSSLIRF